MEFETCTVYQLNEYA